MDRPLRQPSTMQEYRDLLSQDAQIIALHLEMSQRKQTEQSMIKRIEQNEENYTSLKGQINNLEQQCTNLAESLTKSQQALNTYQKGISDHTAQLAMLGDRCTRIEQNCGSIQRKQASSDTKCDEILLRVKSVEQSCRNMENKAKQNGEAIKRRLNEIQELKLDDLLKTERTSIMDEIMPSIRSCVKKSQDVDEALADTRVISSNLESKIRECKADVTKCVQMNSDIQRTVQKLREPKDCEVANLKAQVKRLRESEKSLGDSLESCTIRTESNSAALTDIRSRLYQLYRKTGGSTSQNSKSQDSTNTSGPQETQIISEKPVTSAHCMEATPSKNTVSPKSASAPPQISSAKPATSVDSREATPPNNTVSHKPASSLPNHTSTIADHRENPTTLQVDVKDTEEGNASTVQHIPVVINSSGRAKSRAQQDSTRKRPTHNSDTSATGWFGGAHVVRHRVERYYVGRIDPDSNEAGLHAFLQDNGLHVTYLRLMQSQRDNALSAQINIAASDTSRCVLERGFWPKGIRCREWKPRSQWFNQEHKQ